jgi:hypothetical protein
MPVFRVAQGKRTIDGRRGAVTSVVILPKYTVNGEETIITKDVNYCEIYLDSKTTENITIKSMTDTLIVADYPIDEEYYEVELQKGSAIQLSFVKNVWYIMSSDGLKTS